MPRTIEELLEQRPADPANVARHRKRMERQVRLFRLREVRKRAHLTQAELAGRLHVSQNRISNIEHGDIDHVQVDTLRKYVEAVGGELQVVVKLGEDQLPLDLLTPGSR